MKFPAQTDIEDFSKTISVGFVKGAAVGVGASALAAFALKRRAPGYLKNMGGFQRNLIWVTPAIFFGITSMELASSKFEEHKRDLNSGILPPEEVRIKEATIFDNVKGFLSAHQYKFIVGGWAASIAGSLWLVNKDKYLTRSQKIVQARVYAQGATVAMLLLSVLLSVEFGESKQKRHEENVESQKKSWERDLQYVKGR